MSSPTCPYCNTPAAKATGKDIYPHRPDLWQKGFWLCRPCDAYAGDLQHPHYKDQPIRLANRELRQLKMRAHEVFDRIWKSREMSRNAAYAWLAKEMNLPPELCHIGMFDADQCRTVIQLCLSR